MKSSQCLMPNVIDALQKGRAIPLMIDYRHPYMPDHTMTVIGMIDSGNFESAFIADALTDPSELVHKPVDIVSPVAISEIQTDSADARAVHELWALWNGGGRNDHLRWIERLALALAMDGLKNTIKGNATNPPSPVKKTKETSKKRKPRALKSARGPARSR